MALSNLQLIAATEDVLVTNGYQRVDPPADWPTGSRLYEDDYGIVALYVYDTWMRLRSEWNVAQGQLVDLMSNRLGLPDRGLR